MVSKHPPCFFGTPHKGGGASTAVLFLRQQNRRAQVYIASLVYSVCDVYRWRVSCRVLLCHGSRRVSGDTVEQLALALSALDLLRRLCFAWPWLVPGAVEPAM